VLSGLEGLLEIMSLEMMTKSVGAAVHIQTVGGREFRILAAEAARAK